MTQKNAAAISPVMRKLSAKIARAAAAGSPRIRVCLGASSPNILVAYPTLPVTSVRELIALAKARRGELNYSSSGSGTSPPTSSPSSQNGTRS